MTPAGAMPRSVHGIGAQTAPRIRVWPPRAASFPPRSSASCQLIPDGIAIAAILFPHANEGVEFRPAGIGMTMAFLAADPPELSSDMLWMSPPLELDLPWITAAAARTSP